MMEKLIRLLTGTKEDEPHQIPEEEFNRLKRQAQQRQDEIDRRLEIIETYARQAVGVRQPFKRRRTDREREPRT